MATTENDFSEKTIAKSDSAEAPAVNGASGQTPPVKPRRSLSKQIMTGLVLGLVCGFFFGEMVDGLKVVGIIFIKLLQVTVIPYISLSLITGIGRMSLSEVKANARRGGRIYLIVTGLTLAVVMLTPLAYPAWPSASFFSTNQVESVPPIDFLRLFIPSNPAYSYANGMVPAVVLFSILIGIALINIPKKAVLIEPLSVLHEVMMKITGLVARVAPIGVFALIASVSGSFEVEELTRLQVYVAIYVLVALVLSLVLLPGIITIFTPFGYRELFRALHTPLITAFATGNTLIILPLLIEHCKQLIADKMPQSADRKDADASIEMLIPAFYPFPNPALMLALSFVLYAGWHAGQQVAVTAYPSFILAGVPSMFGGVLLAIPFMLNHLQLPSDLFQVFIMIQVFINRFGTLVAAMHFAAIGLIGALALSGQVRLRWSRLVRVLLVSAALIVPALLGVRAFYTHVVVVPYTKADLLKRLDFLDSPQTAEIHAEVPAHLAQTNSEPASLAQIEQRGLVRVCYQPDEYPSAFLNTADPPQLVGFDIEMAHRFARRLQLPLEFIPAKTESDAEDLLNRGSCDIYMRTLPVTLRRTANFGLTAPVFKSALGLIVRDHQRDEFQNWEDIRARGKSLRLGVENKPGNLSRIHLFVPEVTIVPIQGLEEAMTLLASGAESVDAIVDMAEEGAALTLLYPSFSLVVPKPAAFFPVAYAVARGNDDLLIAFDTWLLAQQAGGAVDRLYQHWMLGGAAEAKKMPRWSVIRNVLGWVE